MWTELPGAALDVGASADGTFYVIGTNDAIFKWTGSTWDQLPGAGTDIGVGADGSAWVIG